MGYVIWKYDVLLRLCRVAFSKFGFAEDESRIITDVLLQSDVYGIESHGMQRMVRYHMGIKKGLNALFSAILRSPNMSNINFHFFRATAF